MAGTSDYATYLGARKEVTFGTRVDYISPVLRDWLDRIAREKTIVALYADGSEVWTWLGYSCPSCGTLYKPAEGSQDWHCPACGR